MWSESRVFIILNWMQSFLHKNHSLVERNGRTHFSSFRKPLLMLKFGFVWKDTTILIKLPLSNTSEAKVWVSSRLYTIMVATLACNVFTISACWNTFESAHAAALLVATMSMTIAGCELERFLQEPWSLVLVQAQNHQSLSSIRTQWGPQTCSAGASSHKFGDMHG